MSVAEGGEAKDLLLARASNLSTRITPEFLEEQGVVPLTLEDGRLTVGVWRDDASSDAIYELESLLGAPATRIEIAEADAHALIREHYGESSAQSLIDSMDTGIADTNDESPAIDDLRALANEAPVIRLVSMLLTEALEARASDVHLEAYTDGLRVRYRVDGVLQEAPSPPRSMAPAVISRLKVMANLDIAERRLPQDGRIRLPLQDRQVDVRVSTVPTLHGESVVLRLLDKESGTLELGALGMSASDLARFEEVLTRTHGVVLATGPTGSGKTTTLYAALQRLRTGREKILTVEDPVEYQLAGIPQVPVNEKVGVTFASALRALLRQDPDVMLVGEIRDGETAEIATQAALTGHLVLSTLHTNDAAGALTRLVDLGVAPFLVSATVEAVLAQRLVRTVCGVCVARVTATGAERQALGRPDLREVSRGAGCDTCRGSGYMGRTGVYELLVLNAAMRTAVSAGDGADEVRALARAASVPMLRDDGARLVIEGRTTPEEVLRVCRG
ncbi:type II secretion system ATPase GspE [soil metagenome]